MAKKENGSAKNGFKQPAAKDELPSMALERNLVIKRPGFRKKTSS
jgi:hypothetical protein